MKSPVGRTATLRRKAFLTDAFIQECDSDAWKSDPLTKAHGFIRGVRWPRGKPLNQVIDEILYGR